MNSRKDNMERFHIYRGIVVYNQDPQLKGRVKIFVPGIYPVQFKNTWQKLPWAQPALLIGGGNWANQRFSEAAQSNDDTQNTSETANSEKSETDTDAEDTMTEQIREAQQTPQLNNETGWCSVPHAGKYATDGAQVWVFFEAGDINKPIYFASAQSGPGWFSEHPNQHVFKSDNIRVRIDQEPTRQESTTHFDSYNNKCIHAQSQAASKVVPQMNTLLDIQVFNPERNAVNIIINGNVNMKITGNWYVEHTGDKHETHIGNLYMNHIGDTYIQKTGFTNYHRIQGDTKFTVDSGNLQFVRIGNEDKKWTGNITDMQKGDKIETIDGNETRTVTKSVIETFNDTFTKTVIKASEFVSNTIEWTVSKLNFK